MGLSFEQYRYFSAAWLRDHSPQAKADQPQAQAVDGEAPTPPSRLASVTWLVPQPREEDPNKPD